MRALSHIALLVRKDLTVELRTREIVVTMALFAVLLVIVFAFSFYSDAQQIKTLAPGILWVSLIFTATLGLARLFDKEREGDAMWGVLLSPVSPRVFFLAKVATHFLLTAVVVGLVLPLLVVMFAVETEFLGTLVLALVLGTIGFCFVGALFAATLSDARLKDVLLPLVVYPIVVPVLIAGVKSTQGVLGVISEDEMFGWLRFMAGFDLLYSFLATWLFGKVVVR